MKFWFVNDFTLKLPNKKQKVSFSKNRQGESKGILKKKRQVPCLFAMENNQCSFTQTKLILYQCLPSELSSSPRSD
jgi:hypothetical protein